MELVYARLAQVVNDIAVLGGEFNEGLADDVLGQIADILEVEDILEGATDAGIDRTQARINEALQRAKEVVSKEEHREAREDKRRAECACTALPPGRRRAECRAMQHGVKSLRKSWCRAECAPGRTRATEGLTSCWRAW